MTLYGALEVLDRSGQALHRVRIEQLPFRLGRALDNDFVLDDPHVCAHHAELRDEGGLALFDLGSVNGCYRSESRERRQRIDLYGRMELRLGHSNLRFRAANETLAGTQPDPLANSRLHALDSSAWAVPLFLLASATLGIDHVLGHVKALTFGGLAGAILPGALVFACWALAWSLVNRVVSHRFHYFGHLAILSAGLIAAQLIESLLAHAGFALGLSGIAGILDTLLVGIVVATIIYGHLRLVSRGEARRLLVPSVLTAAGYFALTLLPEIGKDSFRSEPDMAVTLKPPVLLLRSGTSSERFYADAAEVFEDADEDAAGVPSVGPD